MEAMQWFLVASLIATPCLQAQSPPQNVSGSWAVERGTGHRFSELTLKQDGEKVEGTWLPEGESSSQIDKGTMHAGTFAGLVFRHNTHYLIVGHLHEGRLLIEISRPDTNEIVHGEGTRLPETH